MNSGIIPTAYYRTYDPDSFEEFLSRSDILICSLPSTRATEWLLTKARLSCLPTGAVLINVGRGDLFRSGEHCTRAVDEALCKCGTFARLAVSNLAD